MKFSGDTIVAPRLPSRRATYPPAKPPPITSVPPSAAAMTRVLRDFGEPAREEAPLGLRLRKRKRATVRSGGLVYPLQATQKIRACSVIQVVLVERQVVHERETVLGPFGHRDRDGPIQLDDRRPRLLREAAVERGDLCPVGALVGVQRRDRRLQLVRPRGAKRERTLEQAQPFVDPRAIPEGPVLVREQHELAVQACARVAP